MRTRCQYLLFLAIVIGLSIATEVGHAHAAWWQWVILGFVVSLAFSIYNHLGDREKKATPPERLPLAYPGSDVYFEGPEGTRLRFVVVSTVKDGGGTHIQLQDWQTLTASRRAF